MVTKSKIFYYFYIFFILKSISCYLVFPFKTISENLFPNINTNSKEYNSTHFLKENFQKLIYTTIKVGNPAQEIKSIITYNDCNFKIGKAKKCVNSSDYLSHFNRNLSDSFSFTDFYAFPLSEFDYKGHSAEDIIYAYTDLKLETLKKYENIGFYLGSDTNDSLCGIIGFKRDNDEYSECNKINNIIRSFKSKYIIPNYQWSLKYTSKDEGIFILGADLNDIISNIDVEKIYVSNSVITNNSFWSFSIQKVICTVNNNNYTVNKEVTRAEINNDFGLIQGTVSYNEFIEKNFFKEYFDKNICKKYMWYLSIYFQYFVIECDKTKFSEKDIKNFPSLEIIAYNSDIKFDFDSKELFTETKYKYFFNIIFSIYKIEYWVLGKLFLKKYLTMIDLEQKLIKIYAGKDEPINGHNLEEDNNSKRIIILIVVTFILVIVFGTICYCLGKNWDKIRKKRANELKDDDYDYTQVENNNAINNIQD